jgi:hypothetical protein
MFVNGFPRGSDGSGTAHLDYETLRISAEQVSRAADVKITSEGVLDCGTSVRVIVGQ